jgi:2,5-diketo-D-gluconate reductase B
MELVMIERTIQGQSVPALGLGTWRLFGSAAAHAVSRAVGMGYRLIDTAQAFGNERELGRGLGWVNEPRETLFLTTKLDSSNYEPDRAVASVDESLRRLGTGYVDLLLLHWPDPKLSIERTVEALAKVQQQGKAGLIGLSHCPPTLAARAATAGPIFCNAVEYHPFLGQRRILAQAEELDYLVLAAAPLAKGRVCESSVLADIGEAHNKTPAQVALRWLLQQNCVAAVPKAGDPKHREQNFEVFDFALTEKEMEQIRSLERGERHINPPWAPPWE